MIVGNWEIVIIVLALILLFGAGKLPELARSFGKAVKEFREAKKEIEEVAEDEELLEALREIEELSRKKRIR